MFLTANETTLTKVTQRAHYLKVESLALLCFCNNDSMDLS